MYRSVRVGLKAGLQSAERHLLGNQLDQMKHCFAKIKRRGEADEERQDPLEIHKARCPVEGIIKSYQLRNVKNNP